MYTSTAGAGGADHHVPRACDLAAHTPHQTNQPHSRQVEEQKKTGAGRQSDRTNHRLPALQMENVIWVHASTNVYRLVLFQRHPADFDSPWNPHGSQAGPCHRARCTTCWNRVKKPDPAVDQGTRGWQLFSLSVPPNSETPPPLGATRQTVRYYESVDGPRPQQFCPPLHPPSSSSRGAAGVTKQKGKKKRVGF